MEDEFGLLPDELVKLEERQDLSQYSYDPTDMLENVNSDVALMGELSSQPSSQEKLFDFFTEHDQTTADYGTTVDVLDLLGISAGEQLPSFLQFENGDQLDSKADADISETTTVGFIDSELDFDVSSPGTSPGSTSLPDSTTFFALGSSELDACGKQLLQLQLSDGDLLSLSTRDLNRRIRHLSQDLQQQIKSRRRTLKNRGYAQTCRTRRVGQRHQLENDKERLSVEIQQLTDDKTKLLAECDRLRREGAQYKSERDIFQNRLLGLINALAENGFVVQESD